jgi:hypothetical protein
MSEKKDRVTKRTNDLETHSRTWIYLDGAKFHDYDYAAAYKEAGDRLVRQLTRGRRTQFSPDLFMPILYLYRHSLELELKNLVRFGSGLLDRDEKLSNALGQHNLYELWHFVKKICEVAWPGSASDESISHIEELLLKLHAIDASGQNLRYSTDKSGHRSQSSFPKFIQLKSVSVMVGQVISLLNAMHDALGDFFFNEVI